MNFNHVCPVELLDCERVDVNGRRNYVTPHGTFPSITTVLGSTADKSHLTEWENRIGRDSAARITNNSAKRGTNLHQMAEDYLNNRSLSCKMPDALEMFYSIRPILNNINNIHFQEKALYSKTLEIAGTVDCIGEYNGILSVIDFKNSRKTKREEWINDYFLQTCFYALAYAEMTGMIVKQLVIIIAVEDESPQVFIKPIKPYISELLKRRKMYK